MTDNKFTDYEGKFGTWSGYPEGVEGTDLVEVIFNHTGQTDYGFAYEYGWNKSDIKSYRKVKDVKTLLRLYNTDSGYIGQVDDLLKLALAEIERLEVELKSMEDLYDSIGGHV
jgi:hypothetical protein